MTTDGLFIALDIDGTVLLEDGSFAPGAVDAVAAASERNTVTLSTGRSWDATSPILDGLGLTPEYVVSSNGAAIMSRTDAGDYARHTIETFDPTEVLQFLVRHLPDASYLVELPDGGRLFSRLHDDWNLARPGSALTTVDEMHGRQVTRVVVVSPDHSEREFNAVVEQMGLHGVSYSVGWSAWLDIAPQGINKATALAQIIELLGVDGADVVTIGDGRNDIEMLSWAREIGGRSFSMGQAPPEVHAAASEQTASVEDGGVAAAFRTLGVI